LHLKYGQSLENSWCKPTAGVDNLEWLSVFLLANLNKQKVVNMSIFGNGSKTVSQAGEYYGSHPGLPGHVKTMLFIMTDGGVDIRVKHQVIKHFDWSEVTGFDNQDIATSTGASRLTVTRMATLGVFSLAAPKKGAVAKKYVAVLHTTTGDVQLETKLSNTSSDIGSLIDGSFVKRSKKAKIFVVNHATGKAISPVNQATQDIDQAALQLEKLAALKQKGIITEEDFQAKKKQILNL
jgi:hypothetical protein